MTPQGYTPPTAPPGAHEGADLNVRVILRVAVTVAVLLALVIIVLFAMLRGLEIKYAARTSEAAPRVVSTELPPEPRLQTEPLHDLQAVRAAEDLHLNRYLWVDRVQGVAQIPIERAMELWLRNYSATSAPSTPPAPDLVAPDLATGPSASAALPPAAQSTPSAAPATSAPTGTNSPAGSPPVTELQMRQKKAQESTHVP